MSKQTKNLTTVRLNPSAKAIVLWGLGGTGKTTTLNLLIDLFPGAVFVKGSKSSPPTTNRACTVIYKNKKIAILTVGDDESILNDYFNLLPQDCDLYVCASRTKGSSVKYLETLFKEENLIWYSKCSISNTHAILSLVNPLRDDINNKQTKDIKDIIDKMIGAGII